MVIAEELIVIVPHFRYLQTLSSIAAERNSTIVFPLPIEVMGALMNKNNGGDSRM